MTLSLDPAELRISPVETMNGLLQRIERSDPEHREALTVAVTETIRLCFQIHANTSESRRRRLVEVYAELSSWLADSRRRISGAGGEEFTIAIRETLVELEEAVGVMTRSFRVCLPQ